MGDGSSWTVCTEFLERVKVRMDTLHEPWTPDASTELFGVRSRRRCASRPSAA